MPLFGQEDGSTPPLQRFDVVSSMDGKPQPVLYWAPEQANVQETPLLVFLHSWSGDYRQDNSKWLKQAVEQGWIFLHPNFRGANNSPQAGGSRWARQDILDAMDEICRRFRVDPERVYLAGVSGGGHMSMLMAGHHPDRFSAVSAWVGISDLAEWHRFHTRGGTPSKYAKMIEACLGGPPGTSEQIDADYRDRSPLYHIARAHSAVGNSLPVAIWAGVDDGHSGSVPVSHSLLAFNQIALAGGSKLITDAEIRELLQQRRLTVPTHEDLQTDAALGRKILLRRRADSSMVTIFAGGHESIPEAAIEHLKGQRRRVPLQTGS
ncbi:MAG: prolyl oligopeptidase family serine peptidase [Planctomycetaceae bacterium]|nr:prolyl oligopeptidase family serine peptidase [Planctomycetaceae bacterium]